MPPKPLEIGDYVSCRINRLSGYEDTNGPQVVLSVLLRIEDGSAWLRPVAVLSEGFRFAHLTTSGTVKQIDTLEHLHPAADLASLWDEAILTPPMPLQLLS